MGRVPGVFERVAPEVCTLTAQAAGYLHSLCGSTDVCSFTLNGPPCACTGDWVLQQGGACSHEG
jgi:hypothetical protein